MEPKKYQYIDSLRGIAILLVLLTHNLNLGNDGSFFPKTLFTFCEDGLFGVQLFFMVSAYTLLLSFYSRQNEKQAATNFFIRRFFRIAPLYYVAVLYFTFQNFLGFHYFTTGKVLEPVSLGRLLSNIFFVNGFNPYWINNYVPGGWSIATEMIFYVSLPIICRYVKNANSALLLVLISLLTSFALEYFLHPTFFNTNSYLYYYFPNQLPVFSLGILAFFIQKDGFSSLKPFTMMLLAVSLLIFRYITPGTHFTFSLVFFILLLLLSKYPYRLWVNKISSLIGQVSFSLYLVHFAIIYWMEQWGFITFIPVSNFKTAIINFMLRYLILFSIAFAISYLTYQFIEKPGQKIGKWIIARKNKKNKVTVSSALPLSPATKSIL